MTEVIEQNMDVLEGEVILSNQGIKLFKNIEALSHYVSIFAIKDYVIRDGYTQDGEYVVQLQYNKTNWGY